MEEFIEIYNQINNQYGIVGVIIAAIILIIVITLIIYLLSFFLSKILKYLLICSFKFLWFLIKNLFKFIWFIIKKIIDLFKYIVTTHRRKKHRKELDESIFNPKKITIPFKYRTLNIKVKKQINERYRCIEKCMISKDILDNETSFITMIEAQLGGGKTSFLNGKTHYQTISIVEDIIPSDLESIEKKIYQVNYAKLRIIIENLYNEEKTEDEVKEIIMNDYEFSKHFIGTYDDQVSVIPKQSLLKIYIRAYYAKLRMNYTMCNYKMYNRITKTYNYDLAPDLFNIKDEVAQKKFFIPSYSIIIDDEKALSEFKNTASPKELDNKGADTALRLFRQLLEERSWYTTSTQNNSRIALLVRELANAYISIENFKIVGHLNALANIYRKKEEKQVKKMYRKAKKIKDDYAKEEFISSNNEFKEKIHHFFEKQQELFAAAFVKYHIKIAKKLTDLTKDDSDKTKEYDIYFPLTFVFGVYRKCEYSEFMEYLQSLSDIKSANDLKVATSLYDVDNSKFENLIRVKEKEKKPKRKTSEETN